MQIFKCNHCFCNTASVYKQTQLSMYYSGAAVFRNNMKKHLLMFFFYRFYVLFQVFKSLEVPRYKKHPRPPFRNFTSILYFHCFLFSVFFFLHTYLTFLVSFSLSVTFLSSKDRPSPDFEDLELLGHDGSVYNPLELFYSIWWPDTYLRSIFLYGLYVKALTLDYLLYVYCIYAQRLMGQHLFGNAPRHYLWMREIYGNSILTFGLHERQLTWIFDLIWTVDLYPQI